VFVIVHFSQGAEANFQKGVRPLPAVHSVSLDSCVSLLDFFPKNQPSLTAFHAFLKTSSVIGRIMGFSRNLNVVFNSSGLEN
jgi:hypothetical protein